MRRDTPVEKGKNKPLTEKQLEELQALAGTIRYGSISLIFQDGLLVQIDRNEKFRVTGHAEQPAGGR